MNNKKFIVVNLNKITKKHFDAMQRVYPNTFFLTNRNQINEIKTIKLVEDNIIQNVDNLFSKKINQIQTTTTVKYIQKFCNINNKIVFISSNIEIPNINVKIRQLSSKKISDINIYLSKDFKFYLKYTSKRDIIKSNQTIYLFDSIKSEYKYLDIPSTNFNYHTIIL
ncbi:MAG: hypothetical protein ACRCZ2_08040 [Fusobacteriaceae bacterium]